MLDLKGGGGLGGGSSRGRFEQFFNDWMSGAAFGAKRRTGSANADIPRMIKQPDSWPGHVEVMASQNLHRLVIGAEASLNLCMTEPRRNLLVLGPPRSEKTAGVLMPAILCHPGPLVSTSTKADVLRATGLVRARLGKVWHYSPDGAPTPPGCTELRWSPIPPSTDWGTAIALGKSMADVAETGGSGENAAYFRIKAGVVIAALLHAAALEDKPMRWMLRAVAGDERVLSEASKILNESFDADAAIAATDLDGVINLDPRSKGPILSTTANAFAAYRLPGALATTERPNFDSAEFVAGGPKDCNQRRVEMRAPSAGLDAMRRSQRETGYYDSIYITASSERQALVAPLVVGLLQQIREATFARHRADEAANYFTRPAVLWALDEVAGIAPMRDLPETLSQSGGQGLLVAICLQDLQMARAKWDKAADAFLTLFGNVVVHPGIRDEATLRAISTVIGQHWVDVGSSGSSETRGKDGQSGWNSSTSQQLVARLEPGAVAQGRVAEHPHFVLGLTPSGWDWFFCTPYYAAPPWPQMLVGAMELAAAGGTVLERSWALQTPILDRDGNGAVLAAAGGPALVERYRKAISGLQALAQKRQEVLASFGPESLLRGYDDSWTVHFDVPVRAFIALQADPGSGRLAATMMAHSELRAGTEADEIVIPGSVTDAVTLPFGDPPESSGRPDWVIHSGGLQMAHLNVIKGGIETRSSNSIIRAWHNKIPTAAVLIEAWAFTSAAMHMVHNLAADLETISPTCILTAEWLGEFGSWNSTSGGTSNVVSA